MGSDGNDNNDERKAQIIQLGRTMKEPPMPPKPDPAAPLPAEVLAEATARGLTDVLVLGYTPEGRLYTIGSGGVLRADALWMVESARMFILTGGDDDGDAE